MGADLLKLRARVVLTLIAIALPLLWIRAHAAAQQDLDVCYTSMRWFGRSMAKDHSRRGHDLRGQGPLMNRGPAHHAPLTPRADAPIRLSNEGDYTRYLLFDLALNPIFPPEAKLAAELAERLDATRAPVEVSGHRDRPGEASPAFANFTAEIRTTTGRPDQWLVVERYSRVEVGGTTAHLREALPEVAVVLVAALLALGPLIGRIRRLTVAVSGSGLDGDPDFDVSGSDEITGLAKAFASTHQAARKHLETAQQRETALRSFVDNTTHDVAVPLSTLQGHLSELSEAGIGYPSRDQQAIASAQWDAAYVASLIGNLASSARLESSGEPLAMSRVDLGSLVERVGLRHRSFGATQGVAVNWGIPEQPVTVSGDATLLEQALGNLVQNAIRHGASGGHVALTLQGAPRRFELVVLDDGPGVDEEALEFLDQRHYRGDEARGRHPGGRGLGLAITQEVLEYHDFEWSFGNGLDGGFVARITGPLL